MAESWHFCPGVDTFFATKKYGSFFEIFHQPKFCGRIVVRNFSGAP